MSEQRHAIFVGPAAGAKATYDAFHKEYGVQRWTAWEKLTQVQQRRWVRILAAGMRAAMAADEDGIAKYLAGEGTYTEPTIEGDK